MRTLLLNRALSFRDSMHSLDQTSNFCRKNSSFLPVTSVTTLSVIRQRGRHCCRVVLRVLHASDVQWVLSKGLAFGEEFRYCRRYCWKWLQLWGKLLCQAYCHLSHIDGAFEWTLMESIYYLKLYKTIQVSGAHWQYGHIFQTASLTLEVFEGICCHFIFM